MTERLYQMAILILLLLLLVAAMVLTSPVSTVDGRAAPTATPTTHHILLEPGDDLYALCANGQLRVTANGADSIYIECGNFSD